MKMSLEVASSILIRVRDDCKRNKDDFGADAIIIALECMQELHKQKLNQHVGEDIKGKFIDSALSFLMSYLFASMAPCNDREREILTNMLEPMRKIVEGMDLLRGEETSAKTVNVYD